MLRRLSDRLAQFETLLGALLAGAVTVLILLNIFSRSIGHALYWIDELAIYCMVWMTFITTSAILKRREAIAVTLLIDLLPPPAKQWAGRLIDLIVLVFALALLLLTVRWFNPLGLAKAGFNVEAFQAQTFNFIYSEKTNTLSIRKIWVWLPLLWVAVSMTFHSFVNLFSPNHLPHSPLEESL